MSMATIQKISKVFLYREKEAPNLVRQLCLLGCQQHLQTKSSLLRPLPCQLLEATSTGRHVDTSTRRHVDTSTRRAMTRCSNWASPRPTGITTGKAGPTSPVRLEGSPIGGPHFSRWLLQKWQQLQLATTGYYWQLLSILVTKIMSLAPDYSSTLGYEFYFERPVTKSWDNDLLLHILLDSCSNQCQNDAVKLPSQAWAKRFGTSIQLVVGLGRSQRRMIFFWLRPFLSLKSLQVNCPHPFFCGSFAVCGHLPSARSWRPLAFGLLPWGKKSPAELIRTAERPRARRHACKGKHIIEILKYWHRPHHAILRSARAFCREGTCV